MNAKEAREKALSITGDLESKQYETIKKRIQQKVDIGQLSASFDLTLYPAVKIKLEAEGYKISTFNERMEGTTTNIKW